MPRRGRVGVRAESDGRRPSIISSRSLVLATGILLAISALAVAGLSSTAGDQHLDSRAGCPLPTGTPRATSTSVAGFSVHVVIRGDFSDVAAAAGRLVGLEICGARESSFRLVALGAMGTHVEATRRLGAVAPLASGLAAAGGHVYVGEARLVLHVNGGAPYRLTVSELAAENLEPIRTISLGRGYGAELAASGGTVLASGGTDLRDLTLPRPVLARFPGFVIEHIALLHDAHEALLGLFRPAAVPPAVESVLALVEIPSGRLLGTVALPPREEVEALAADGSYALASVSLGRDSTLELLRLTPRILLERRILGGAGPLALVALPHVVLAVGPSMTACLGTRGRMLASAGGGLPPVQTVAAAGGRVYAVVPGGLVRLVLARSCMVARGRAAIG